MISMSRTSAVRVMLPVLEATTSASQALMFSMVFICQDVSAGAFDIRNTSIMFCVKRCANARKRPRRPWVRSESVRHKALVPFERLFLVSHDIMNDTFWLFTWPYGDYAFQTFLALITAFAMVTLIPSA